MYSRKENLRLIVGILIVLGVFIFLGLNSCESRYKEIDTLIHSESKYSDEVPDNFSNEVLDVPSIGGFDVKVSDNKKIVGFSMPYSSDVSFDIIKSKLQQNNWKYIENGNKNNTTFFKDEGNYTWLFLNCVDIGGTSSAVFTSD